MQQSAVIEGWQDLEFHFFPEPRVSRLRTAWGDISIRAEQPVLIDVIEGATMPGLVNGTKVYGVYDRDNCLVPASALLRGRDSRADADLGAHDLIRAVADPRDAYYLGRGDNHYGHFILETLCRAWAWEDPGKRRVPIIQSPLPPFAQSLYGLIPDLLERIEVIRAPTRFRSVLVPGAAFVVASAAYVAFKTLCDRMADRVISSRAPLSEQPVYLSRAGLSTVDRRTLEGEIRLEEFLRSQGFLIARPETLPIDEQIRLVNSHRWFVGPMGSACHTRLFSRGATNLIMLTSSYFNPNYALCDLLCEGSSHYVNVFRKPDIGTRIRLPGFAEPVLLDAGRLLGILKRFDLIRADAVFDSPAPDLDGYKKRWIKLAKMEARRNKAKEKLLLQAVEEVSASLNSAD